MNNVAVTDTAFAREGQTLEDHLSGVAQLAKIFASPFGAEECGWIVGILHDLGKYSDSFQDYLIRSIRGEDVRRGEVIHALQGARYVVEKINDNVISDILGNSIGAHHGGLFDTITDGERTLALKADKDDDQLHYSEVVNRFSPEIDEKKLQKEILRFCKICQEKRLNAFFMLHFLTKAIFSSVVDADRCNSAGLEIKDEIPDWNYLIQEFEHYIEKFSGKSKIDTIRTRISVQCQNAGTNSQGIYTLSVPTGGGKTLSSLRFALEHGQKHKLKRIIYVIPYLSILEQTAAEFNKIFSNKNGDLIFEHHSNIELSEKDEDEERHKLLASRWDSTIILTTMVQFLESIYSNKASKLRKFHNMSEAVFIFDEIQSLPIKCTHLFNDAINFLHVCGKSTILLCTATQPHLHKTDRPVFLAANPSIFSITSEELEVFNRVRIEDKTKGSMDYEEIAALVKCQIDEKKSTLVILNTKADAHAVYERCRSILCEKAFLTTDLCPAHRLTVLDRVRKNLKYETKRVTLCVSTQLIEAGVDISFDCVIRAQAGMDSIIQAAGRCNRNAESPTPQTVFIVDIKTENLSRLPEIKDGKNITQRVFREKQGVNLLDDEVIDLFYDYYFFDQKNKMDFQIIKSSTTIYSLLSKNPLGTAAYKSRHQKDYSGLPCAFQKAADEFSVIDGGQIGIIVPYGNAMKLVSDFENTFNPKIKIRILKELQKYSVSVYIDSIVEINHAVSIVDNMFYLLSPDYYDVNEQGLKRDSLFTFLCV